KTRMPVINRMVMGGPAGQAPGQAPAGQASGQATSQTPPPPPANGAPPPNANSNAGGNNSGNRGPEVVRQMPTPEEMEKMRAAIANAPEVEARWYLSDYRNEGGLNL